MVNKNTQNIFKKFKKEVLLILKNAVWEWFLTEISFSSVSREVMAAPPQILNFLQHI